MGGVECHWGSPGPSRLAGPVRYGVSLKAGYATQNLLTSGSCITTGVVFVLCPDDKLEERVDLVLIVSQFSTDDVKKTVRKAGEVIAVGRLLVHRGYLDRLDRRNRNLEEEAAVGSHNSCSDGQELALIADLKDVAPSAEHQAVGQPIEVVSVSRRGTGSGSIMERLC
jgi:hypothetical protein